MPRKTSRSSRRRQRAAFRFNEAAARCRGKLELRLVQIREGVASMRPRPDAAENVDVDGDKEPNSSVASMRPRPDAAENASGLARRPAGRIASMRPRPDAAENVRIEVRAAAPDRGRLQ